MELLRRGVFAYRSKALEKSVTKPYEIFRQLDLGSGGYAPAPAKNAKTVVGDIIRERHGR